MPAKPKPPCQQIGPWLTANLGKGCLAALTGTDSRALTAAVHIIELYSYDRSQSVRQAFALIVSRMQPSTQHIAYHLIAMVMDWSHRAELWEECRAIEPDLCLIDPPTCRCAYEPGGNLLSK